MSDRKIGLPVLDNDPVEAAGLRFYRLRVLIDALYQEAMEHPMTRLSGLAELALSEIEQADAEYSLLIGVTSDD
tara:strand:+ start:856 stop:1077 length:222 start_codon:yes stop_codon:yes gene_type:complete